MPSILGGGGNTPGAPGTSSSGKSCRMGSWLQRPGAHLHPLALFPSASAGKGSPGGPGAYTPQTPVFWGHAWPLLLGRCGCSPQPRAARGGSDTRDLSQAPSVVSAQKYSESCSVPGSRPICPPPLPGCVACPFPTLTLATSIDGHQYSQGPRSPGKGCEGVGCPPRSRGQAAVLSWQCHG